MSHNCILIFACNLFNYIINKNVFVFIFNTWIDVILNVSVIVFKRVFCFVSSFSFDPRFNLFLNLRQIVDAYVIIGFTMTEYICLILKKMFFIWISQFSTTSRFALSFLFSFFWCMNFNSIWCLSAISTFLFKFLWQICVYFTIFCCMLRKWQNDAFVFHK